MADKFKKIDKQFLLTDDSVNSYGFRLLTAGYLIDEYKKNPIGYYMHQRGEGVLVKWENLTVKDNAVYGTPVINLSNPRGQQTVDEIEAGFLNAASFGHFVVLETSDDPALKLPNQTGPTVTKWFNRESSLVDIPGNFNSLTLFDKDDNEINLADFTKQNLPTMEKIFLTAEQIGKLNLKADTANATAVETAFNNLVAEAAKVPQLIQDLAAANTAKENAETELNNLKASTVTKEVESILATALAAKKVTVELSKKLKADYATNPTGLQALVDTLPTYTGIVASLSNNADDRVKELSAKSWDDLDKNNELPELLAKAPEVFKEKYKETFGKEYAGK